MRPYLGSIVIILALSVAGVARDQPASSPPDVPLLLKSLEDSDSRVVFAAASQLTKLGSSIAPALVEALRDRPGCRLQWVASGILHRLERRTPSRQRDAPGHRKGEVRGEFP